MPWFDITCEQCEMPSRRYKNNFSIARSGPPRFCGAVCRNAAMGIEKRKQPYCRVCDTRVTTDLVRSSANWSGRLNLCRECQAGATRLKARRNPMTDRQRKLEAVRCRIYREANADKIKAQQKAARSTPERRAYMRAWYHANGGKEKQRAKLAKRRAAEMEQST